MSYVKSGRFSFQQGFNPRSYGVIIQNHKSQSIYILKIVYVYNGIIEIAKPENFIPFRSFFHSSQLL